MRLVLFDIDGTLISSGGAGTVAWRQAFDELLLMKRQQFGSALGDLAGVAVRPRRLDGLVELAGLLGRHLLGRLAGDAV